MRRFVQIAAVAVSLLAAGCRELPAYFAGDEALVRVGRRDLPRREVEAAIPAGLTGSDSVAFADRYVDHWIKKQLKLQEAEQLFSEAEKDIEAQVEAYRQSLLIRKLDQHYVDLQIDTVFTDSMVAAYYKSHAGDFRLDRTIVKGRVLRFDESYRRQRQLLDLMSSPSKERQQDFRDICAKQGFVYNEFGDAWIDYAEFLGYLPTLRSQNYESLLGDRRVQQMRDGRSHYYFQITDVLRTGDPVPLEQLRSTIRRILFNQRQGEIIRRHEEEIYSAALEAGRVKIYEDDSKKEIK